MSRCDICKRPVDHDPRALPGHYDGDHWEVVIRNGLIVRSCHPCWFMWPDGRKIFPPFGYGQEAPPLVREVA